MMITELLEASVKPDLNKPEFDDYPRLVKEEAWDTFIRMVTHELSEADGPDPLPSYYMAMNPELIEWFNKVCLQAMDEIQDEWADQSTSDRWREVWAQEHAEDIAHEHLTNIQNKLRSLIEEIEGMK